MNIEDFRKICKRCGHSWIPRKNKVIICPKCKSPYWDRERTNKKKQAGKPVKGEKKDEYKYN